MRLERAPRLLSGVAEKSIRLHAHTSPQASINLENSPREVTYVFRRPRGHIRRPHCQSNQISPSFGDF